MKQLRMKSLANHILAVANQNNLPVTNLQLQKIMYFSFLYAINGQLFETDQLKNIYNNSNEPFQVWRYGPVIRNIYELFSIYSANPILATGQLSQFFNKTKFNNYLIKLLRENPFKLVNQSHENKFWKENQKYIIHGYRSNINYSFNDLRLGADYKFA